MTTLKALKKMNRCVDLFRSMDAGLSSQTISVFLAVALSPDHMETRDLSTKTGLTQGSVNRALTYMQEKHWKNPDKPGLKLVIQKVHPLDARQRVVSLTIRGRKLADQIREIIDG